CLVRITVKDVRGSTILSKKPGNGAFRRSVLAMAVMKSAWARSQRPFASTFHTAKSCARGWRLTLLLPVGVSNWGCYGIQAALAILTEKPELAHNSSLEKHLIEVAAAAGLVDGITGKCEATVDGMPVEVHMGIVQLLQTIVERALRRD